jgi:uncharacterized protein (TIGR02594 family)
LIAEENDMKTLISAAAAAIIAVMMITPATAAPKSTTQTKEVVQEKAKAKPQVVKKRTAKKPKVVKAPVVAPIKAVASVHAPKKRKTAKAPVVAPVKVAAPAPKKCQFLFWEVECADSRLEPKKDIKVISKAESMIGLNARKDRQVLATKMSQANGTKVDPVSIPWCAAWANMVLADVGLETTGSLMARSFLAWGKPVAGQPSVGDVVVMRRGRNRYAGHVGFFYSFVDHNGQKMVAVLGGNQGKEVKISYYPISKVIAYRTAA